MWFDMNLFIEHEIEGYSFYLWSWKICLQGDILKIELPISEAHVEFNPMSLWGDPNAPPPSLQEYKNSLKFCLIIIIHDCMAIHLCQLGSF